MNRTTLCKKLNRKNLLYKVIKMLYDFWSFRELLLNVDTEQNTDIDSHGRYITVVIKNIDTIFQKKDTGEFFC